MFSIIIDLALDHCYYTRVEVEGALPMIDFVLRSSLHLHFDYDSYVLHYDRVQAVVYYAADEDVAEGRENA